MINDNLVKEEIRKELKKNFRWNTQQWGESTSSRKTGHQAEGQDCHPTVKNSDPVLFLSKRTARTKDGEETEVKVVQWPVQLGIHLKWML